MNYIQIRNDTLELIRDKSISEIFAGKKSVGLQISKQYIDTQDVYRLRDIGIRVNFKDRYVGGLVHQQVNGQHLDLPLAKSSLFASLENLPSGEFSFILNLLLTSLQSCLRETHGMLSGNKQKQITTLISLWKLHFITIGLLAMPDEWLDSLTESYLLNQLATPLGNLAYTRMQVADPRTICA